MNILIKNATLISMSDNRKQIEENMDILIQDRKVKQIAKNIQEKGQEKIIDATGKMVMPGLINTHAHVPMSIFRETLDGYTLQDWLEKKIWPMEDKLTKEDIYDASILSFLEMIKTGTTTINDMYFMTEDIIRAAKKMGVRMQTTRTLMDLVGDGQERIEELEKLIQKYKEEENITMNIGIHGFYTSNSKYIPKCVELARKYCLPIHIHFCENQKEVEDIKKMYKVESPVQLIKQYFKDIPVILAHSVKLTKGEIEELSHESVSISHCPVSNLKLGCGIAKIDEMKKNGINVTLGTDGQGSGSNLDLFETMKYTALLQKGSLEDPKKLPAYEVLKMATIHGAKALGLEETIGSIEEQKEADLIILNLNTVMTQPINDIFSEIVYNVKGTNVETTIIAGKIVMENTKVIEIEEEEIYKKCQNMIHRIQN